MKVKVDGKIPSIHGVQFLGCVGSLRDSLGAQRWHFRWEQDVSGASVDGFRVEIPFESNERRRLADQLEGLIPPPDSIVAEPIHWEVDLDPIQSDEEREEFLSLLWRWSEFLADLRMRNPKASLKKFSRLGAGAFLFFVTGNRRHLEDALEQGGFTVVPTVSLGRVLDLAGGNPIPYRLPPTAREDCLGAARIHHLAACVFCSEYYPYPSTWQGR